MLEGVAPESKISNDVSQMKEKAIEHTLSFPLQPFFIQDGTHSGLEAHSSRFAHATCHCMCECVPSGQTSRKYPPGIMPAELSNVITLGNKLLQHVNGWDCSTRRRCSSWYYPALGLQDQ